MVLAGTNTYQGTTQILSGTLAVSNATGLGAGGGTAATGTTLANGATLEIDGPFTIANELLTLAGSSSGSSNYSLYSYSTSSTGVNYWTGGITYTSGTNNSSALYLYAYTGSLEVDGNISGGSYSELVPESGPMTFKGTSSVGDFYAESGNSVVVDGSFSVSGQFYDNYNTTTEVDGTLTAGYGDVYGTLSGVGTVTASSSNDVYVYGQVVPGNASGPGTLTVGNFYFANGSSVSGQIASATSFSQLQVAPGDWLTLEGPTLSGSFLNGYAPSAGQQFQIVKAGSGTVSGTFAGLPNGSAHTGR